jgi:hypothetical protein
MRTPTSNEKGTMTELVYEYGTLSPHELEEAFNDFLAISEPDEATREDAEAAGVALDQRNSITPNDFKSRGGGFGGVGEALVIWAGTYAVEQLIERVFIPWLQRRSGKSAVGQRVEDPAA